MNLMGGVAMDDVENIINILDDMCRSGNSRIKVNVTEDEAQGSMKKEYHHGRCDVGSPFAKGTIRNFGNDIIDTMDAGCS